MGSKKRAPSLWLNFDYGEPGDILVHEVFVPNEGLASETYYCCLNWNTGMEGGGYCGIQDHPQGRAFIFSIWDSEEVKGIPITAPFKGPGTQTEKFGGEGTGLKSMNFETGWKENQWYTMVVRRWDSHDDNTTYFGFWVHDHRLDVWHHLVTMEYPVPKVFFRGRIVSFLEDWGFTSENARCVRFRNGFKRLVSGSWVAFKKTQFQVNVEATATMNYNAEFIDQEQGVCIRSGGRTKPSVATSCIFANLNCFSCPQNAPIKCVQLDVTEDEEVTWELAENSTPQLRCKITAKLSHGGAVEIYQEITGNVRSVSFGKRLKVSKIVVELEDILGKKESTMLVAHGRK